MKTLITAVAAAATLATVGLAAAPAAAQPYGAGYSDRGSFQERQQRLQWRIAQGERSGQLSRREAWTLRTNLWQVVRLEARYRYDGRLSWRERADLDRRLDRLSRQVRVDRHDNDHRRGRHHRF